MEDRGAELWWQSTSDVMFDVEDVIDYFKACSKKLSTTARLVSRNQPRLPCFAKVSVDHKVAKRIKDINKKLDEIKMNKQMFSLERTNSQKFQVTVVDKRQTSYIDEPEVVGRDIKQAADEIVKLIISSCHESRSTVLGIEGMGGIGKTTLAQRIYNDHRIMEKFQVHMWLCITETYNEIDLLKQAVRMAGGECDQLASKAELLPRLMHTLKEKSVFLVLDDVWKSDVWIDLLQAPLGRSLNARILVTSRNLDVLAQMHPIYTQQVNIMNDYDGLELLMKKSFGPYEQRSDFSDVGYQILKKCDGLPLAINVVAGVLSTKRKRREWEKIRDSKWSTQEGLTKELRWPLYLSYLDLPPQLKHCFLWCALLPPNFEIKHDVVSYLWIAEGFVIEEHGHSIHETAEGYYYDLIRRNLLQPIPEFVDKGESRMHDLLRSLGEHLTRHHSVSINAENKEALPNLRRLGVSSDVEEMPTLEEQKCIRSLLVFSNKNFKSVNKDIFKNNMHIRVLVLSGTGIKSIPESVGNMVLLRLLDLSETEIEKLPESIGGLISLEYLSLRCCRKLDSLPASFMTLGNINYLDLAHTAIDHVPEGLANFRLLFNLKGVFECGSGFRWDELQGLPSIQHLWIEKLEKATPGGTPVLNNSHDLRELGLCCTMGWNTYDRTHYGANEVEKIEQVCEMLGPSPSLQYIFLVGFPGVRFPEWLCSEPEDKLPNLAHMHLNDCISCLHLPPAGQMPELQVLQIKGADAVVSIGPELLGKGVTSGTVFFPKLELLHMFDMYNLESWSLDTGNMCENKEIEYQQQSLMMPRLERLFIRDCPKLRALPKDLRRVVNLKRIHIEGAHNLQEVADLPAVVWLKVKKSRSLRRISNLCKLQDLCALDCLELDQAENLSSLKRLCMVNCPSAQRFRNCLLKELEATFHCATLDADDQDIFTDESVYH